MKKSLAKKIPLLTRLRMIRAFFSVVRDVERTDEVFALSERIPESVIDEMIGEFKVHPRFKKALEERPLMKKPDLQALATLPAGTLGKVYSDFMLKRGLDPDFYPTIPIESTAKYFRLHTYQTHDLWHVVTGFDSHPAGELGLQAFYLSQFNLPLPPMLLAAGLLNAMLFDPGDVPNRVNEIARGWNLGRGADQLFGFDWQAHWATPLEEVRAILRLNFRSDLELPASPGRSQSDTPLLTQAIGG